MASHLPLEIISHKRRITGLYKKYLRFLETWGAGDRIKFMNTLPEVRAKFEENRHLTDPAQINKCASDLEELLWKRQHWQPMKFAKSIGGLCYGRVPFIPDSVLDYWHPLEKAQYPEYFARREKRKEEFIQMWDKEYGNDPDLKSHH